ncbi:MAG: hypothetical protein IKA83_06030 [Paludibacteraceae bacterium]|nr:hypothetical protein [Paludibacteraceae bacterium]
MATITLEYDARNSILKSLIEGLSTVKGIKIIQEQEPRYNRQMVEKINRSKKEFANRQYKVIKTEDLWK